MSDRPTSAPDPVPIDGKKRYAPPSIEMYGDVRDLTLGGSPGKGESGNPKTRKNPTML